MIIVTKNTDSKLQGYCTSNPEVGNVYLALLHGRTSPDKEIEDYDTGGIFIGPLDFCHIKYSTTIDLGFSDGHIDGLGFSGDLLYFDGVYYGEWQVLVYKG